MKICTDKVEIRHAKTRRGKWYSGLDSYGGYVAGRIVEVVIDGSIYVGIVYPFKDGHIEDFGRDEPE